MIRRTLEQESRTYRQQVAPLPYQSRRQPNDEDFSRLIIEDWVDLNRGHRVVFKSPKDVARMGTVDDVSADASIVWVWLDGIGRILVHENDEVVFWTTHPED